MFYNFFSSFFISDLAIDLGTANTLIYAAHEGVVLNEPSVVALVYDNGTFNPCAFGHEAKLMLGRTHSDIRAIRPLKDGVIAEFKGAEQMIKHFICSVNKKKSFFVKPRVVVCVPYGSTPVEKRAIQDAIENAGAREVYLIYESMAAAIGANLPITEPISSMIVDIGGGTTEVSVICLGGQVASHSVRFGGDSFDETINSFIRKNYNLYIGEYTAERIKKEIGTALVSGDSKESILVKGRHAITGLPKEILLSDKTVCYSINETIYYIIDIVKEVLEKSPSEVAADIAENGITLTGGGSLLRNLDLVISKATSLKVRRAADPLTCVVRGTGRVLEQFDKFKHVLFRQD